MDAFTKVVMLGSGAVGKTALIIQFVSNQFSDIYDPTIEEAFRKEVLIDDIPARIEILDTAGQEEYVALRHQWIREGEAFLLVYSCLSQASLDEIEKFKKDIDQVKESNDIPIILVANKCDMIENAQVSKEQGLALAKKLNVPLMETSAKTGMNVEKAFFDLMRKFRDLQQTKKASRISKKKKIKCIVFDIMAKNSRKRKGSPLMSSIQEHPMQRNRWVELNKAFAHAEEGNDNVIFTIPGPENPPPLIIELQWSFPQINNLQCKIDFKASKISNFEEWMGTWKEATKEIIKETDDYIRLKVTDYPWGKRRKTHQIAWFSFKINDDDSQIYRSPETQIISQRTAGRHKGKVEKEEYIANRDAILEIPNNLKRSELFSRLSDKDPKGNIFAHAIFRNKPENTKKAIELLSSRKLTKDQRKQILMNVNKYKANVLHAAAARGNLQFLEEFRKLYKIWGLTDVDIRDLLTARDTHDALPYQMALFQQYVRGNPRSDVLEFIENWMISLGIGDIIEEICAENAENNRGFQEVQSQLECQLQLAAVPLQWIQP